MTLAEAADLLIGLGATDGFGFDYASVTFVAAGEVRNLPVDGGDPAGPPTEGREVAPGHRERPVANGLMVVANPPPSNPSARPGPGPVSAQGPGAPTATAAPPTLTTAGGGPAPATGEVAAPSAAAPVQSLLPGVGDILRNPTTKRPRRQPGKGSKGHRAKTVLQPQAYAGDPSIPDWNDITAALAPEAVPVSGEPAELSFGFDSAEEHAPGPDAGANLIRLLAAGMIVAVLCGQRRVRRDGGPQRAVWLS